MLGRICRYVRPFSRMDFKKTYLEINKNNEFWDKAKTAGLCFSWSICIVHAKDLGYFWGVEKTFQLIFMFIIAICLRKK